MMEVKNMHHAYVNATGTAVPPVAVTQEQVRQLMDYHYGSVLNDRARDVLHKALEHPSIKKRYLSVHTHEELLRFKNEDRDARIDRFTEWGVRLCAEAARAAMQRAGVSADEITAIVVNTCTGYICPGFSTYLIEELGLAGTVRAQDLVGSGCGGAVPNIQMGAGLIADQDSGVALCLAVEICSATFEMANDLSLIISNTIFGDGAAAAIVSNKERGFRISGMQSVYKPEYRDDVRYIYKDGRLHNRISSRLPAIVGDVVPSFIHNLIKEQSLTKKDIRWWAVHPGGAKMLDLLQEKLELSDEEIGIARTTYLNFGNMSSPTVLFELDHIMYNGVKPGDYCVMTAYGAGLSIHGCVLCWVG